MISPPKRRRYAVVGAGISGLAAAYELVRRDGEAEVCVYEASDRAGGSIRSERCGDFLLEHGPDMFTTAIPAGIRLAHELALEQRLIDTRSDGRQAFIVRGDQLLAVPVGFQLLRPTRMLPLLSTPLLSLKGKLRLLAEPFVRRRKKLDDESLASFATRRLGQEAFERLVQPLVAGMYTADPHRLSMEATLPAFRRMEQAHGSLLRATLSARRKNSEAVARAASGARYNQFKSFDGGMQVLVDALVAALPPETVQLGQRVEGLQRVEDGWELQVGGERAGFFDAVLLAVPAFVAGALLEPTTAEAAAELSQIEYASSVIALFVVPRSGVRHPLNGFGAVVPDVEHRDSLALSFASRKFAGRAPEEFEIFRVFMGGALRPELCQLDDAELRARAMRELQQLIGLSAEPVVERIVRWERSMPQYTVGHLDRVTRIRRALSPLAGLELTGNALEGIGIPQCIAAARNSAGRLATALAAGAS